MAGRYQAAGPHMAAAEFKNGNWNNHHLLCINPRGFVQKE